MKKKGFVVSAILYPLLVLFLALIMGMLSMTDTRKRILDRMKLEIEDSIFDDETCSCDTILNKLNWLIKNGVGGGASGSYTFNVLTLRIHSYPSVADLPNRDLAIGDIGVISDDEVTDYYIATVPPSDPKEGSVWVVQDHQSNYYIKSDYSRIGISYVMQYKNGSWYLKKSYVFDDGRWQLLYYVNVRNHDVDFNNTDINGQTEWTYSYKGEYQTFRSVFSGYYKVELWGAQGGNSNDIGAKGGLGAYTSGLIYLDAGTTLYVYVGGTTSKAAGGWNGGGNGNNDTYGKGGGGSTDIRLVETFSKDAWNEFESLKSRIMVAAGGGGSGGEAYSSWGLGHGGAGGGILGYNGSAAGSYSYPTVGGGGTQGAPGGNYTLGGRDGVFALGGNASAGSNGYPGGGGGGYYGGGGGFGEGDVIGGPGGGSSYISGHVGCSSIDEDSTSVENIMHNGSPVHFSGYYFVNTKMVDGNGYAWTQVIATEAEKQMNNAGTGRQVGQSGNGYAKITLSTIEYISPEDREEYAKETFTEYHYTYAGSTSTLGSYQTFTAPESGYYQMELWGSQGGNNYGYVGGLGAYTKGEIYLNKNQKVYVYVGSPGTAVHGGWNGGGTPYTWAYGGSGGGGATDIRLSVPADVTQWDDFNSLKTRIMIAGGGGGGSNESYSSWGYDNGGAGGGIKGLNAPAGTASISYTWGGSGGGQTSPGYYTRTDNITYGNYSSFAHGGNGTGDGNGRGGGGGGGYYGGGGGFGAGDIVGGGGGGSSYISGHEGCSSLDEDSTPDNLLHNGSAYHYSGYYFKNTKMVDGQGYNWGVTRKTQTYQPTWDGKSTQTGESRDGHARITLIEKTTKTNTELDNIAIDSEHGWYYEYTFLNRSASTGKYQKFTAPKNGYYKVELWGASGITPKDISPSPGLGAYTSGEIYLDKGTTMYVYVGSRPDSGARHIGGWNGGGNGNVTNYNSGGGGATDIRLVPTANLTYWDGFESLKSRIMVAAGGGGGGGEAYSSWGYGNGAAGGGIMGYDGGRGYSSMSYSTPGIAATQTAPGYTYTAPTNATGLGSFGKGGNAINGSNGYTGGGGAGYYGGGGGYATGDVVGGAASGSSYISGHTGCNSMTTSSTESNTIFTGSSYHYSGHYFINTVMIDGAGYNWNSQRNELVNQPVQNGTGTQTGNNGDGYAKITFLRTDNKTTNELKNAQLDNETEWHYTYSGSTATAGRYQTFTATKTGYYSIALWGAQGGYGGYTYGDAVDAGGLGGYTYGEIYLTKGTTLYVYVGNSMTNGVASWNGGGAGSGAYGGSGGGAVDIRITPGTYISVWNDASSLSSRIMVAAGGGGGSMEWYSSTGYAKGGPAGGLTGYNGPNGSGSISYTYYGTGATQTKAGVRYNATTSNVGGLGYGGVGTLGSNGWGGGGGGGYYGGGGGYGAGDIVGGGGGGSSYISGKEGCIATSEDALPVTETYTSLADSINYTNYQFTHPLMIDGNGKIWTTSASSQLDYQPTYNGVSNQTGNFGVGHAKINYLGA